MKSFITCLPRSRSAFFATMMTWTNSIFYHDIPIQDSLPGVETGGDVHYGVSDSSLVFYWTGLHALYPNAKWVVIRRSIYDVIKSCRKITENIDEDRILDMQDELDVLQSSLNPLVVDFSEITPRRCYDIAEYLGVDIGPAVRVCQLCDMNIQIHPPVLRERLRALNVSTIVDTEEAA